MKEMLSLLLLLVITGLGVSKMIAKEDVDWMDPEQFEAHIDNHKESLGYHTVKKGEKIPEDAIHGQEKRPLVDVMTEAGLAVPETDEDKKKEKSVINKKERKKELFDLNKADQVVELGKLGVDKVPRTEAERVELILKLEAKK